MLVSQSSFIPVRSCAVLIRTMIDIYIYIYAVGRGPIAPRAARTCYMGTPSCTVLLSLCILLPRTYSRRTVMLLLNAVRKTVSKYRQ